MYWDAAKSTYTPVDQSGTATASEKTPEPVVEVAQQQPSTVAKEKPKAAAKTAAQIAKVSKLKDKNRYR